MFDPNGPKRTQQRSLYQLALHIVQERVRSVTEEDHEAHACAFISLVVCERTVALRLIESRVLVSPPPRRPV